MEPADNRAVAETTSHTQARAVVPACRMIEEGAPRASPSKPSAMGSRASPIVHRPTPVHRCSDSPDKTDFAGPTSKEISSARLQRNAPPQQHRTQHSAQTRRASGTSSSRRATAASRAPDRWLHLHLPRPAERRPATTIQTHAICPPAAFIIARPGSRSLGRILFIRTTP